MHFFRILAHCVLIQNHDGLKTKCVFLLFRITGTPAFHKLEAIAPESRDKTCILGFSVIIDGNTNLRK